MKLRIHRCVGCFLLGLVYLLLQFDGVLARISKIFPCPIECECDIVTQQVDCSDRGLNKLPANVPTSTRILLFEQNALQDSLSMANFNITPIVRLRKLTLTNNSVTEIGKGVLEKQGRLIRLDLSFNHLQSVPHVIREMRLLKYLYITLNFISFVNHDDLPQSSVIEHLYLDKNTIVGFQDGAFKYQTKLRALYLGQNLISNISRGLFSQLSQMVQLDLSYNKLGADRNTMFEYMMEDIPTPKNEELHEQEVQVEMGPPVNVSDWFHPHIASSLETLYLAGNMIKTVAQDAFVLLPFLKSLNMSKNEIAVLPPNVFEYILQLQRMVLSENHLRTLPDNLFTKNVLMEFLDISNNSLSIVPVNLFNETNSLYVLDLSGNELVDVRFVEHNLHHLVEIDLSRNKISDMTSVGFTHLVSIEILTLAQNELYSIPNVRNLTRLRVLDLSMNMIHSIPHDAFAGDVVLEVILLQLNQIITILPEPFQELFNLVTIDATGNPIHCDCNVKWYNDFKLATPQLDMAYEDYVFVENENNSVSQHSSVSAGTEGSQGSQGTAGSQGMDGSQGSLGSQASMGSLSYYEVPEENWATRLQMNTFCVQPGFASGQKINDALYLYSEYLLCNTYANPRSIMILILTWFLIIIMFLILFWSRTFWLARKQLGTSRPHAAKLNPETKAEEEDNLYVISSVSKKTDNGQYHLLPDKHEKDPLVFLPNHDDESCKLRTYDRNAEIFIETTV